MNSAVQSYYAPFRSATARIPAISASIYTSTLKLIKCSVYTLYVVAIAYSFHRTGCALHELLRTDSVKQEVAVLDPC